MTLEIRKLGFLVECHEILSKLTIFVYFYGYASSLEPIITTEKIGLRHAKQRDYRYLFGALQILIPRKPLTNDKDN